MSNTDENGVKTPLGVMGIISESFSIFTKNFVLFFGIALVVQLIILAISLGLGGGSTIGINVGIGRPSGGQALQQNWILTLIASLLSFVGYAIVISIISLAAFDIKTNKKPNISEYFSKSFSNIIPLFLLLLAMTIIIILPMIVLIYIGTIFPTSLFLVVPLGLFLMLYLFGMFSVSSPSIVIEGTGFHALGRSIELTRGYRGKIIGLYFILFLAAVLFMLIIGIVFTFVLGPSVTALASSLPLQILNQVLTALVMAFSSIVIVMLFARLKEIKEGYGFENVGDVFD